MCFSATASFGAGLVLSTIGGVSIKKASSRSQIFFAAIPLLFAIQQTLEGFLWLALPNPALINLQHFTTYGFLFFAQIVWTVWVPLAMLTLEPKLERKQVLKLFLAIGLLEALYQVYCIFAYHVNSKIIGYHVSYILDYPATLKYLSGICYILPTIVSPFFSSIKRMWMVGTAILISCIITVILYTDYVVSVWCFFASIISITVLVIMYQLSSSKPAQVTEALV